MACNRARVRFQWERAALALRCWVRRIGRLIVSATFREHRPPRNQIGTSRAVAVRTWATVRCGFFPPMGLVELGKEQVTDATEDQVPLNRAVRAHLEMIHPQFPLAVLEHPLDLPAAERLPAG